MNGGGSHCSSHLLVTCKTRATYVEAHLINVKTQGFLANSPVKPERGPFHHFGDQPPAPADVNFSFFSPDGPHDLAIGLFKGDQPENGFTFGHFGVDKAWLDAQNRDGHL